jgi:hypothetical protein
MTLELIRVAGVDDSEARELRRSVAHGDLCRVRNGAFVSATDWELTGRRERHRSLVLAVMASRRSDALIVSHRSAAAMHGLPWIGRYGDIVNVLDPARDRGHLAHGVRRIGALHRTVEIDVVQTVPVTSLAVTGIDLALVEHPLRAVAALDDILRRGVTKDDLVAELDRRAHRSAARVRHLIDLADAGSESPGESATRWSGDVLGAPRPESQRAFSDDRGLIGRVDFWYPEQRVVLEFDGRAKYTDAAMRNGRTAGEVVVDEKVRENRLRRHPDIDDLGRAEWSEVMPGGRLPHVLLDLGVPLHPQWPSRWTAAARRWDAAR